MVIDMTDDPDVGDAQARTEAVPEGVAVRAWFGLKQVRIDFSIHIARLVDIHDLLFSVHAGSFWIPAALLNHHHRHRFHSTSTSLMNLQLSDC